jgi:hypothetical protein
MGASSRSKARSVLQKGTDLGLQKLARLRAVPGFLKSEVRPLLKFVVD